MAYQATNAKLINYPQQSYFIIFFLHPSIADI